MTPALTAFIGLLIGIGIACLFTLLLMFASDMEGDE